MRFFAFVENAQRSMFYCSIPMDSGMTPLENENFPWPEINLEQVDDFLLAELLKLDDYGSDACGSRSDTLTPQLKHMTISARKSPSIEALKPTLKVTNRHMPAYFHDCHSYHRHCEFKNVPDYSAQKEKQDLGYLIFDLQADLNPLFNWNAKQLFVFLTAEYESPDNKLNQVVLWDKIIQRGENANLDMKNMNTSYYFWDDGNGLRGNPNVTLTLSWNVIPNAEMLSIVRGSSSHTFSFPNEYTNVRAQ